jgi:hypothetical protein
MPRRKTVLGKNIKIVNWGNQCDLVLIFFPFCETQLAFGRIQYEQTPVLHPLGEGIPREFHLAKDIPVQYIIVVYFTFTWEAIT